MFKRTDRQVPLFTPASQVPKSAAERLKATWAEGFQREVLPVLLEVEGEFASLYSELGRPNWSVARLIGLMILQDLEDLDDQSVLDRLMFDVRYQHALGVASDDAYLSRRSFVAFRSRLAERDPKMKLVRKVFESIRDEALADLRLSSGKQRLDSTQIMSNIQNHARADLFGKTLRHFVLGLQARWPDRLDRLDVKLREWALSDAEGWFGRAGTDRRVVLQQRAAWALSVVETFAADKEVADDERYQFVVRLLAEQCVVVDRQRGRGTDGGASGADAGGENGAEPAATAASEDAASEQSAQQQSAGESAAAEQVSAEPASDADVAAGAMSRVKLLPNPVVGSGLQSPFDPDAGYGHKGRGYLVQITETCGNQGTEIVTDYGVVPANVSDKTQVVPVLERLGPSLLPQTLFADSGYATMGNMLTAREQGVELYAPVIHGQLPKDFVGREAFTFDETTGEVTLCPQGHRPVRHGLRSSDNKDKPTLHAYFDGKLCRQCPLLGRCAARSPNNGKKGNFHVELLPSLRERDLALDRQRDAKWWKPYQIRSGIEATASELKRRHGMGRLRVRRKERVTLKVALKTTACNVKRWVRAILIGFAGPGAVQPAEAPQPA
jgi:hypothetical protein